MDDNLILYHFPTSSCSQKVRVVLAEKGLKWQSKIINLLRFEQLKPDYIKLNPEAVVPTLVHNGKAICDSATIVKYLEETFPSPSLQPANAEEINLMNTWFEKAEKFPLRELTFSRKDVLLLKYMKHSLLPKKIPILERLRDVTSDNELKTEYQARIDDQLKVDAITNDPQQIEDLYNQAKQLMDDLENHMQGREYICGDMFTLADVMWMIVLHRYVFVHLTRLWQDGRHQAVDSYFKRLKTRRSFHQGIMRFFKPWVMMPLVLASRFKGPVV